MIDNLVRYVKIGMTREGEGRQQTGGATKAESEAEVEKARYCS